MAVIKTAVIVLVVYWQHAHASRINRSCYPVDCKLSWWSEWSACTTPCGVSGTQSSYRHRIINEECGGTCSSTFRKTRACPKRNCFNGGSLQNETCFCRANYSGVCCQKDLNPVNCQLSRWSQWSACTTPCGVNGTSSSYRYRIATEQRGGTCTTPFRKTKACPQLSCLNGGSLQNKTCLCREEYSGVCCEEQTKTRSTAAIAIGTGSSGVCLGAILYVCYRYCKYCRIFLTLCREL